MNLKWNGEGKLKLTEKQHLYILGVRAGHKPPPGCARGRLLPFLGQQSRVEHRTPRARRQPPSCATSGKCFPPV